MKGQVFPFFIPIYFGGTYTGPVCSPTFFAASYLSGVIFGIICGFHIDVIFALALLAVFVVFTYFVGRTILGLLNKESKISISTRIAAIAVSLFLWYYAFHFTTVWANADKFDVMPFFYLMVGMFFIAIPGLIIEFDDLR